MHRLSCRHGLTRGACGLRCGLEDPVPRPHRPTTPFRRLRPRSTSAAGPSLRRCRRATCVASPAHPDQAALPRPSMTTTIPAARPRPTAQVSLCSRATMLWSTARCARTDRAGRCVRCGRRALNAQQLQELNVQRSSHTGPTSGSFTQPKRRCVVLDTVEAFCSHCPELRCNPAQLLWRSTKVRPHGLSVCGSSGRRGPPAQRRVRCATGWHHGGSASARRAARRAGAAADRGTEPGVGDE
jgi:hypothetical protein